METIKRNERHGDRATANHHAKARNTQEFRAAKAYAAAGWHVGFLPHGSKVPDKGGKGLNSLTDDLNALAAWRAEFAGPCNVCGTPPEGTHVVDVDLYKFAEGTPEHAGLKRAQVDLPPPYCKSARGGTHHLLEGDATLSDADLRQFYGVTEGIDVKKHGKGYVLLYPSTFEGKPYTYTSAGLAPGPVPAAWAALPARAQPPNSGEPSAPAADGLAALPLAPMGPRAKPWQTVAVAKGMLAKINCATVSREVWVEIGMALEHLFGEEGWPLWDAWSATDPARYNVQRNERETWNSFRKDKHRTDLVGWKRMTEYALKAGWTLPLDAAPELTSLWKKREPQALTEACVPPGLWNWAQAIAAVTGFDPRGYAMAAVVACAAAVHHNVRIRPQRHNRTFAEPAILYGGVVGLTGSGKTHTSKAGARPCVQANMEFCRQHEAAMRSWQATSREVRGPQPVRDLVLVEDVTVDKLGEMLAREPHNVLWLHDELAAMHENMSRSAKHGQRTPYLVLWNGEPANVDRIGRGEVAVPFYGVCILGNTTPDTFAKMMAHDTNDGLLPRFMMLWVRQTIGVDPTAQQASAANAAEDAYVAAVMRLYGYTPVEPVYWTLDAEGERMFKDARVQWDTRARDLGAAGIEPVLAALLAKCPGHAARVALAFHAWEWASDPTSGAVPPATVPAPTVRRALVWMALCLRHLETLSATHAAEPAYISIARAVADYVMARREGAPELEARELVQHVEAWRGSSRDRQDELARVRAAAVEYLTDAGWLLEATSRYATKTPTRWLLNPRIWHTFAADCAVARKARDARTAALRLATGKPS